MQPCLRVTCITLCASVVTGCSPIYSVDNLSSSAHPTLDAGFTDAGPSMCDTGAFFFCDGFENGLAKWSTDLSDDGTVTTDSANVYRGRFALHAHLPATTAGASPAADVNRTETWPPHLYARVWAYLPAPLPQTATNLMTFVQSGIGVTLFVTGGEGRLATVTFGISNKTTQDSTTSIATDKWNCLELEIDSGSQIVNVSLNGTVLGDLSLSGVDLGTLRILSLGLNYTGASAGPAYDGWLDEVAVNDSAVGCGQ
jgi:hypothetical protein